MNKLAASLLIAGNAIAVGSFVGYKISTDKELREYINRNIRDAFRISKRKVSGMTEDVAMRTARITRNPKINQEWVANQWETIGY